MMQKLAEKMIPFKNKSYSKKNKWSQVRKIKPQLLREHANIQR